MGRSRTAQARVAFVAASALVSASACAHVKWFVDYDITQPPLPIGQVLSGTFVSYLLVSTALIYLFFLVDRYLYKKGFLAAVDQRLRMFDALSIRIMRISVAGRLVALGLQAVFMLAILKFGLIDAVGHLMIIATLFVLVVRGATSAREMLVLRDKAVWTEAYFMTGLYFLALVMIFILYYWLHYAAYGA